MPNIEIILRQIHKDLVPQFEEKLRTFLATQDREWLIEQIVRMALDAHSLQEMDRKHVQKAKLKERSERFVRLSQMALDCPRLITFVEQYAPYDRDKLIQEGYLRESAPIKGTDIIRNEYRTPEGNILLLHAKDVLFGLLFGDESNNTRLNRIQRELLTFTVPRFKAGALDFMKAATQFRGAGTWQDPDCVSDDEYADNAIFEVEFGEVEGEWVGRGIVQAMRLINHLEVNEQILYARMVNIEESTLVV